MTEHIVTKKQYALIFAILMLLTLVCLLAASRFVRIRDVYGAIGEEP